MGAKALFAGTKQMGRLQAFMQRDMSRFENGPNLHGELLAALFRVALPKTVSNKALRAFLARLRTDANQSASVINRAAMRANRTLRPQKAF